MLLQEKKKNKKDVSDCTEREIMFCCKVGKSAKWSKSEQAASQAEQEGSGTILVTCTSVARQLLSQKF